MKSLCDICDCWAGLSYVALYYFYATTPVCKAVLWFESLGEILKRNIQMEGIERYFHAVLFIMLYKAVLSLVDEILKCDQSSESPEHLFIVVLFVCTVSVSRNLRFFSGFFLLAQCLLCTFLFTLYISLYFFISRYLCNVWKTSIGHNKLQTIFSLMGTYLSIYIHETVQCANTEPLSGSSGLFCLQ